MSNKKNIRKDNTYMICNETGQNPKLGAKILSDGRESLFLDYYLGYTKDVDDQTGKETVKASRKRESLKLYLWQAPRTPEERQTNKETIALAKTIRFEREQKLLNDTTGYRLKIRQEINFIGFYKAYLTTYTKKDVRMLELALKRFVDFLTNTPRYTHFAQYIKPDQLDKDMMRAFAEYLQSRSKGGGAKTIFQRFKKVINYAVEHDVMRKNPCKGITIKVDDLALVKAVLTLDEQRQLMLTHYEGENAQIRRAFIFCLYTGMRFCDVKDLTYNNIDFASKHLHFDQNKTKGHSAASRVDIGLNDMLLAFIGNPPEDGNLDQLLFRLPTYESCLKHLQKWVKQTGITKHISWHCARHSFATSLLINGADIKTVASLLGHSGLRYTEMYTRVVDSRKQMAINSLPDIVGEENDIQTK